MYFFMGIFGTNYSKYVDLHINLNDIMYLACLLIVYTSDKFARD